MPQHMEMAKTAGKMEPETSGMDIGVEEWLQPRHWGAPPDLSMKRVSERLAVMVTEKGLEEYRRSTKARKGVRTRILDVFHRRVTAQISYVYNNRVSIRMCTILQYVFIFFVNFSYLCLG